MMLEHNHLARTFRAAASSGVPHLTWHGDSEMEAFEIGAIVTQPGFNRNIVVARHDGRFQSIHASHQYYHALTYPLLFPTGCAGWHPNIPYGSGGDRRNVSLPEYMRFQMMHRAVPSHVQRCERLALEYICDAQAQSEARELEFHATAVQQAKYRAASAKVIIENINSELLDVGTPVILPASFTGSPKYYHRLYLDAMALPRRFGKPDLFITMTCNPAWAEIEAALPARSHWTHHPDIVARVFLLKLNQLMDEICSKKLFGKVLAHVHRIEWQVRRVSRVILTLLICILQARGLPHAHILIILENKILCARQVDAFISAEVPNPVTQPRLYAIVTKNMIHKPCDLDATAGCVVKGKGRCCRRYPKSMHATTTTNGDGYPQYRRRGLHTTRVGDRIVTDDWVVPHNPYLLVRFNCHINCEVSSHKRCFKYVYKYVFKVRRVLHVKTAEVVSFTVAIIAVFIGDSLAGSRSCRG